MITDSRLNLALFVSFVIALASAAGCGCGSDGGADSAGNPAGEADDGTAGAPTDSPANPPANPEEEQAERDAVQDQLGGELMPGGGDPAGETAELLTQILEPLGPSLDQALQSQPDTDLSFTVACDPQGETAVTGRVSSGESAADFDLRLDYASCSGNDGFVLLRGSTSEENGATRIQATLSGVVGGGSCTLRMDSLSASVAGTEEGSENPLFEGTVEADCREAAGDASVTCSFDGQTDVDDPSSVAAACSCEGAGC